MYIVYSLYPKSVEITDENPKQGSFFSLKKCALTVDGFVVSIFLTTGLLAILTQCNIRLGVFNVFKALGPHGADAFIGVSLFIVFGDGFVFVIKKKIDSTYRTTLENLQLKKGEAENEKLKLQRESQNFQSLSDLQAKIRTYEKTIIEKEREIKHLSELDATNQKTIGQMTQSIENAEKIIAQKDARITELEAKVK